MPAKFVILIHDWPEPHWDMMLEQDGVLKTWRLESEPVSGKEITATILADHRIAYLNYEGPVSGGRGSVVQWDTGTYENSPGKTGERVVHLQGEKLQARLHLFPSGTGWCAAFS